VPGAGVQAVRSDFGIEDFHVQTKSRNIVAVFLRTGFSESIRAYTLEVSDATRDARRLRNPRSWWPNT
jgi:hypothetical protein